MDPAWEMIPNFRKQINNSVKRSNTKVGSIIQPTLSNTEMNSKAAIDNQSYI